MSRFFVSPDSPEGWAAGLAKASHWKAGYSAYALAHTWHSADDFPNSVREAFERSGVPAFTDIGLIAGLPEYKVALPGGETASQTDLFALGRGGNGDTFVVAVEGKAEEPFGDKSVEQWRLDASEGKRKRLRFLLKVLGLSDDERLGMARCQLLHRTGSAVIEAERLHASIAVMLVHSFSPTRKWFGEFGRFVQLLGAPAPTRDGVVFVGDRLHRPLYLGWVSDPHPEVDA